MPQDTIAACATAPGFAALAVIRLSGPAAFRVAAKLASGFDPARAREARLLTLSDADGVMDRAIVIAYPAPRSFTGEDVVEYFCHGGAFTAARVVAACLAAGAREAWPGEFTRRAVLHGKLDLLQAEATGDLLLATSSAQAAQALGQLDGNLSRRIGELRESLLRAEALLAYSIDFPEEDDGPLPLDRVADAVAEIRQQLEALLATSGDGERVRNGALVVLAGPPNAGKSSLFNALLGLDRALVTEIPGTTRDAITADTTVGGLPVRLVDTAGIREGGDRLEALGISQGKRWLAEADLVIWCQSPETDKSESSFTTTGAIIMVATKSDLHRPAPPGHLPVSALTGEGIGALGAAVAGALLSGRRNRSSGTSEPLLTRARHREAVVAGLAQVRLAEQEIAGGEPVLVAAALRAAAESLQALIGASDNEAILDRLFADFCVGK